MAKKRTHPLIEGLFSLDGRMRRSEYWIISICLGVLKLPLGFLANVLGEDGAVIARGLIDLLFFWPGVALMVKRGHDRNRPALFTVGVLVAIFILAVAAGFFTAGAADIAASVGLGVMFLYVLVEYGCLDGTQGPNRYGRSPKGIGGDPDNKLADVFA